MAKKEPGAAHESAPGSSKGKVVTLRLLATPGFPPTPGTNGQSADWPGLRPSLQSIRAARDGSALLLGQSRGDNGHGAVPAGRAREGPERVKPLGASELPRRQGFAPEAQNAWTAHNAAPRRWRGGGLLHGQKRTRSSSWECSGFQQR